MEKAKYKVGERVIVRGDLIGDNRYGGVFFAREMEKYRGRYVRIKKVDTSDKYGNLYEIHEDRGRWWWHEDMFEEKQKMRYLNIDMIAQMQIQVEKVLYNDPVTVLFYRFGHYDKDSGKIIFGKQQKVVAKCNKAAGDVFDEREGLKVAILKAFRKEIDKQLRKC